MVADRLLATPALTSPMPAEPSKRAAPSSQPKTTLPLPGTQKSRRDGSLGNAGWMISFSDLLSLILTFFVLLFAMKEVRTSTWQPFVEGIRTHMQTPLTAEEPTQAQKEAASDAPLLPTLPRGVALSYVEALFRELDVSASQGRPYRVRRLNDRLVISIAADRLLEPDAARLRPEAGPILQAVADRLRFVPNRIVVAAHTDRADIAGVRHPSQWEWTIDRAAAVAAELADSGFPGAVSVLGFGDGRGWAGDAGANGRIARARIDIMVMRFRRNGDDVLSFR